MPFVDAALPVQKATVAWLKNDPDLFALVGGRVYDGVPANAIKPYVSLGPFQLLPERADCSEGGDIFFQVDGWAAGPETVTAKKIGAAIAAALDGAPMLLDNNRLVMLELQDTQYFREPDGLTAHAAITMRAMTEPL